MKARRMGGALVDRPARNLHRVFLGTDDYSRQRQAMPPGTSAIVSNGQATTSLIESMGRDYRSIGLGVAWIILSGVCPRPALADIPSSAEAPKVTIEGGPDATGDSYVWTITNRHRSPIVYVEFPHYQATLFFAPEGWSTKSTFLVNVGVKTQPGICSARADAPSAGVPLGGRGTFRMQIHQSGTRQGSGTVLVRFADGDEVNLPGVSVPIREALSDRYGPLIGLGAIFVLLGIIQACRRAAARRASWKAPG